VLVVLHAELCAGLVGIGYGVPWPALDWRIRGVNERARFPMLRR
jgi:hypothetical protein